MPQRRGCSADERVMQVCSQSSRHRGAPASAEHMPKVERAFYTVTNTALVEERAGEGH